MATSSVSGLVSGLDTATIISQLMQIEAASQTRLKIQVTAEQSTVKSLQDLNSKLAALATSAAKLAQPSGWNPMTVTSSSTSVSVTAAGASATPGSVSLTVQKLAAAHSLTYSDTAKLTDVVTTGGTKVRLDRLDGTTPLDIETGDGTLAGLVKGLNAAGTGVQASTVKLDDGSYRLRVTATATGTSSDFALTNLDGSDLLGGSTVTAGQDAEITVGTDLLHSATNTFTGVVSGLDITLKAGVAPGTVVTLDAVRDSSAMAASVKGMVDAVNSALADIDKLSSYNSATKTSGALAGDGAVRAVRSALLETVYPSDGSSMASLGVQTDRFGKLVFDEAAFTKAYAADPAAVSAKFTGATGFSTRIQTVAKGASDSVDGTITTAIKGRNAGIDRMQDSIEAWDNRLALRRATLTRQFSGLETALSKLNSQSNWLSGQIASLNPSQD